MKWLIVALLVVNGLLVLAAVEWSPPGTLDVAGAEGTLPRVGDLKLASTQSPARSDDPQPNTSPGASGVDSGAAEPGGVEAATGNASEGGGLDPADGDRQCLTITGFDDRQSALRFMREQGLDADQVRVDRRQQTRPPYHWVLIPPFPSRQAALERLEELQRGGVDSYLVTEGEYRNAISLGLFESETLASDLNARFQMKNIETVLVNVDRNQIRYALVFEAAPGQDLKQIVRAAERATGDSELGEKSCL